jgi:hypothetical protein
MKLYLNIKNLKYLDRERMHHHEVKSLIVGEKFVEAEALISHSLGERAQMLGHVHFEPFLLSLSCHY